MPSTRHSDPQTSFDAADSVTNLTAMKQHILKVLKRPRTDVELLEAYKNLKTAPPASDSGLRTRRSELVDLGLVIDSGMRKKLPSGRFAVVWERADA